MATESDATASPSFPGTRHGLRELHVKGVATGHLVSCALDGHAERHAVQGVRHQAPGSVPAATT